MVPPEFVNVTDSVWLVPVCTFPKVRLEGLDSSDPGVTPVPESAMLIDGLVASLAIRTLPFTVPAAWGAKETLKPWLCPATSVKGNVSPLMLNPLPLTFACETVIVVPPVLVRVSDWVVLTFTWTLPKLSVCELADSTPGVVPVPESVILSVGFEALLASVTLPLAAPPDCGVNVTLKLIL